ncbi:MAG TPA: sugar kinase [Terriglobales bacterium]|nr:sugar kinase [Terriglobales bacterium]
MADFDVTLAGELNVDLILYGLPSELPVEREILAEGMMFTIGGSSAIVAHNLAALGARVGFIARVGDDAMGNAMLERLAGGGVDVSRVQRAGDGTPTGVSVILQRGKQRSILTYLGTISQLKFADLDLAYLASSRHFHLSSFYLQHELQPRVVDLFRELKRAGLTISLDTNDDPDDRWEKLTDILPLVDVFLPNEREARRIAGTNDVELAAERLVKIVPTIVIKLGAMGAMAQRGTERILVPAVKVEAIDAVGAGDSFNAGFLLQYVRGSDLRSCLQWGNLAGALSTTRAGGTEAFRDRSYCKKFFREHVPELDHRHRS